MKKRTEKKKKKKKGTEKKGHAAPRYCGGEGLLEIRGRNPFVLGLRTDSWVVAQGQSAHLACVKPQIQSPLPHGGWKGRGRTKQKS